MRRSGLRTWASCRRCAALRAGACRAAGPAGAREDRRQSVLRHPVPAPRWPRRVCSPSTMARGSGSGTSSASDAKGFTDNVVELMVGKLRRLPAATQTALAAAGLPGQQRGDRTLALVQGGSEAATDAALWEAVRAGLVLRPEGDLPVPARPRPGGGLRADPRRRASRGAPAHRPAARCGIRRRKRRGTCLRDRQPAQPRRRPDHLRGGTRAAGRAEPDRGPARQGLDRLCLGADLSHRRARAAAGGRLGAPVRAHLRARAAPSRVRVPDRRAGGGGVAPGRAGAPCHRALPDLAAVTRLRVDLFTTLGRSDRAVEVGLDYLRRVGIAWSAHPTDGGGAAGIRADFGGRSGTARSRRCSTCPEWTIRSRARRWTSSRRSCRRPCSPTRTCVCLVIGRMGNLSLEHGNSDASCYAYTAVGTCWGRFSATTKRGSASASSGLTWWSGVELGRLEGPRLPGLREPGETLDAASPDRSRARAARLRHGAASRRPHLRGL